MTNETGDFILKILGGLLAFFSLRWLVRIFAGPDKHLSLLEFKKLTAYVLFIGAFVYILWKEGNRPLNPGEHIFSEVWIFFIISALLTVLSLEKIFDTFSKLLELAIKLRTKAPYESDTVKSTAIHSDIVSRTVTRVPDSTEAGQGDKEGD
jgi:hypothetical protein